MRLSHSLLVLAATASIACSPDAPGEIVTQPICEITTAGIVSGPRPDLCQHLVDRYARLIDTLPIAGIARLWSAPLFTSIGRSDDHWNFAWNSDDLFPMGTDSAARTSSTETFWHEIGHHWLYPHMSGGTRVSTGHRYGSEAPDWLDEAWAVWAEPVALRTRRLRRVPDEHGASLRSLVEMTHPTGATPTLDNAGREILESNTSSVTIDYPCTRPCSWRPDSLQNKYRIETLRRFESGRADTTVVWSDSQPNKEAKATIEAEHFYPLTYSLLRYIRETGGTAAVRELIARYRVDPTPRAETLENLPGLPASLDALQAGWNAFIAERRPEPN